MAQVVQVTRDKKTGKIEDITFFEEFYAADLGIQLVHLKNLLEIVEVAPGMIKVIDRDGNEQNSKPAE